MEDLKNTESTEVSDKMTEAEAAQFRPEKLIPFAVTREEAIAAAKEYYKGRRLLPRIYHKEEHYEEMQGGFVPYLLYSGEAKFNIAYEAQDTQEIKGDPVVVKQLRDYTVRREGTARYRRIQVNASKDVPDAFMHKIEPYRLKDLIPVSEYEDAASIEELTSIHIEEDAAVTKKRLEEVVAGAVRETVNHHYKQETEQNIEFNHSEIECVLFPLWILPTKHGRRYRHFAVNGQTGQITGDLPASRLRAMGVFFGVTLAVFGAVYGLIRLIACFMGRTFGEQTNLLFLFAALVVGLFAASHVFPILFEEMRPPKRKKLDLKKFESCTPRIEEAREKLMMKQSVDKKNRAVKVEDFSKDLYTDKKQ